MVHSVAVGVGARRGRGFGRGSAPQWLATNRLYEYVELFMCERV